MRHDSGFFSPGIRGYPGVSCRERGNAGKERVIALPLQKYIVSRHGRKNMDPKAAIRNYQFAERAKSELIICSQLTIALAGFPEQERPAGKRMLVLLLEAVRSELEFAWRGTESQEFRKAINLLSESISIVESDNYGGASLKISESISAVTTAAQAAWQVLGEHGLV